MIHFSFSELTYSHLECNYRKVRQYWTTRWNKYQEVWSIANSLFVWRLRCRPRRINARAPWWATVVRNLNNRDLSFNFQDEDDFEDEIFKYCSRMSQRHFGGKCDSRRHSTTSFSGNGNKLVSRRSWENFKTFFNKNNCANFSGEKSTMEPSGVGFFKSTQKNQT